MIGPKANKFIEVKQPEGVKDLFSLISFLNDKKSVEKHLKEIQSYTDAANIAADKLVKAEEIDRLLLDAKKKHETASELISDAQAKAESMVDDAVKDAQAVRETSQNEINALLRDARAKKEQLEYDIKELAIARTQADQKDHEATSMLEDLKERLANVERREHEIERKENLLRQL